MAKHYQPPSKETLDKAVEALLKDAPVHPDIAGDSGFAPTGHIVTYRIYTDRPADGGAPISTWGIRGSAPPERADAEGLTQALYTDLTSRGHGHHRYPADLIKRAARAYLDVWSRLDPEGPCAELCSWETMHAWQYARAMESAGVI